MYPLGLRRLRHATHFNGGGVCRGGSGPLVWGRFVRKRGSRFGRATSLDREPLFPADLGPDTIDVTAYPVSQQENYALFVKKCSLCHTLARPINSPLVDASTWTRFVKRMHGKNRDRLNGGPLLSGTRPSGSSLS